MSAKDVYCAREKSRLTNLVIIGKRKTRTNRLSRMWCKASSSILSVLTTIQSWLREIALSESKYNYRLRHRDRIWFYQGGLCAICKIKPKKFAIDHDHTSGKVRGLLCTRYNVTLGKMKDQPPVGSKFHSYLSNPPVKHFEAEIADFLRQYLYFSA